MPRNSMDFVKNKFKTFTISFMQDNRCLFLQIGADKIFREG